MIKKIIIRLFIYFDRYTQWKFNVYLYKLKLFGAEIGKGIKVYGKFEVVGNPKNLSIGDFSTINEGVFLHCRDKLVIGKYCRLSSFSKIYTSGLEEDIFPRRHLSSPVIIGDHV